MGLNTALLGLGSNIYPKAKNLSFALSHLSSFLHILKVSGIYKSRSLLLDNQPDYFNIVVKTSASIEPYQLLNFCKATEYIMQRNTPFKWGPRNIDIDIIDFNGKVLEFGGLTLPHRQFPLRNFVLLPLMEIAPHYIHPITHLGVEKMYKLLDNHSDICRIGDLIWL